MQLDSWSPCFIFGSNLEAVLRAFTHLGATHTYSQLANLAIKVAIIAAVSHLR